MNNVIKLPVKKPNTSGSQKGDDKMKPVPLFLSWFLAIGLMAGGTSMFNTALTSSEDGPNHIKDGRGLASLSSTIDTEAQVAWEHNLAHRLAKAKRAHFASIGRKPTAHEQLNLGEFQGKYKLMFKKGRLKEATFIKSEGNSVEPKYLTDRIAFLNKYRQVMPEGFVETTAVRREKQNGGIVENYDLLDKDKKKVAGLKFKLDRFERLLSLQVSEGQGLKTQ